MNAIKVFLLKLVVLFGFPVPISMSPRFFIYEALFGKDNLPVEEDTFEKWNEVRLEYRRTSPWLSRFSHQQMRRTAANLKHYESLIDMFDFLGNDHVVGDILAEAFLLMKNKGISNISSEDLSSFLQVMRGLRGFWISRDAVITNCLEDLFEFYSRQQLTPVECTALCMITRMMQVSKWREMFLYELQTLDASREVWKNASRYAGDPTCEENQICSFEIWHH